MNTFLIADTHFSHNGITKFLNSDGTKLRPWDNIEEMDEALVDNWNKVVTPKDKVYHLGDVVINRKALQILHRLNGEKVLIKGNHDLFQLKEYIPFFKDIRGSHKLDNYLLTHIPVHPDSLARWANGNIHGHLHSGRVMKGCSHNKEVFVIDPQYYCVSVEHIDYTPIAFEDLKLKMKESGVW